MKPTLTLIAATAITAVAALTTSCNRSNTHPGSITRNTPKASNAILGSRQLDTANSFLTKNAFSTADLQPAGLISGYSSIRGADGQPYNGLYYLVWCNQFQNGLIIMDVTPNLYFDSTGASLPMDDYGYTGPKPSTDTTPRQTLTHLRDLFLQSTWKGKPFGPLADLYTDTALQATLGYLDLANVPNSGVTTRNQGLRKIWMVQPVSGKAPSLIVDDSTGQSWTW